ncbi:NAC domain-containing protein 21/22-like [Hibiscus syriacus]|uniref:NAC domain-containing protein 21/22-like n=1 Tax=Hibiscus syriacus TaxID=106335 RepID=UPI00192262B1|nr:NAC domain-containing protein 21/22-like [Hibiscus syriacus]
MRKMTSTDTLIEVDLNKCDPWDIPETARVGSNEWHFLSQRDRKYATGLRTNRATPSGYWKTTGKDRAVLSKCTIVGMRKTLVFFQGRVPKATKTDWIMHESSLQGTSLPKLSTFKEGLLLCRVFHKNEEISATHRGMGGCYDEPGSSSPLPPLIGSNITLHQEQPNSDERQLHCFCNLSRNQTNPILTGIELDIPAETELGVGQTPIIVACLDSSLCDKKVIKPVLNHLTKLDT